MRDAIEGRRVRLRRFEPRDAETYRGFVNDPEVARRIDRERPVDEVEHRAWYEALVASKTADVFAVEHCATREFIGLVWLFDIRPRHQRAEVRIVLGARTGAGCGTEALELIADYAFAKRDLRKLWAEVLSFNGPAARAFEKAGFVREGLLRADRMGEGGTRVDVVRLGRLAPSPSH